MHAKEQTLLQLLEGGKQYQVPLYQRTYSWRREQVEQLWRDTLDQAESVEPSVAGSGHFLGSLVLAPAGTYVGGTSRWVVVDGQQRLTTLTLALCALRDHVRPDDEREADKIHRQLLINEFEEGENRAKILPTQDDRPSFFAILEGDPGEATGTIGDTYRMFRELLIGLDDPENPHSLEGVKQALTGRLDLVAITADTDDNVHRIFESLNNTGMRLTQGDLLRNYLFMLLPTRSQEVYQDVWRPMEKALGVANLETLALVDLMVEGYEKVNRSDTYREQTKRIRAFESDEDAVVADIRRLADRATLLAQVLQPQRAEDPDIAVALQRLADWGGEAPWPLMLVALERLQARTANKEQVLRVASFVESYLVRRMIAGRSSAGVNRILIQVANDVRDSVDLADAVHRALSTPRRFWPTDQQVREAVGTRNFYWSGKASQRLFVLKALELSYGHKETPDWTAAKPTVEHVMPQKPGPEWLNGLTDPDDPDAEPGDAHEAWVHRLGNLTLTSYNSELSSSAFAAKRERYKDSNFQLTRSLAVFQDWGARSDQAAGRSTRRARGQDMARPLGPRAA